MSAHPWTGDWVSERLDVDVRTTSAAGDLQVRDLVGLAVRVNPRRVHLLVSAVLGKHVPVAPGLVRGAGLLLGRLVADRLAGVDSGLGTTGGDLLARALREDDAAAADALVELAGVPTAPVDVLVLGYAETATGLGHLVGDALGADVLHSTRRPVGTTPAGTFEEAHSHATGHLLLPDDPRLLAGDRPVVLVDDELSTGATVMDTIRGLQALAPRRRWVVAGLVDLRTDDARAELHRFAAELGIEVDVVALATGVVELPADVLARGAALLADHPAPAQDPPGPDAGTVVEVAAVVPGGFRDGGRHGFTAAHRAVLDEALPGLADQVRSALGPDPGRVLVLGTEELMHLPVRVAAELAGRGVDVRVSSTTRSPVLPVDEPGYAVRTALRFADHDRPADGPGPRFAYNVAPPTGGRGFAAAVLVVDDASRSWDDGPTSLPRVLGAAVAGPVVVLTVPSHRPTPDPLRGPGFGSYARDDVGWLLTDLSDVPLEAPVESREAAIQSGRAHYSESLPVEYQPGPAYLELFEQGLAASASRLAVAVGVVTEQVLAGRPRPPVLVSLARAGTPIGVLMRRWAARHGLDLPHLAVSIVRGRGLDPRALDHLAAHHDPADVVFVDGWTGKGAITRELQAAVRAAEAEQPRGFTADLAVVADPGGCTELFGTREDFLIPSACLNSTVSGLVSRTVLRADLVPAGGYHGAKFYRELADQDVSGRFLDTVSACFDDAAPEVAKQLVIPVDRAPTWAGWTAVEEVAHAYGVEDVNLVKPGVGETTRVLLRRVPWRVLVRPDAVDELGHVLHLAADRGVPVEERAGMPFSCMGLIQPGRGDA